MALVVYPALTPSSLRGLFVFLGVIGAATLLVAVVASSPGLVGLGLLILFSEYSASLITNVQIDWAAPIYAAALLVLGEVVYSLASRHRSTGNEGRRTLAVVGLAVLSGFAVLGIVALPLPHGALIRALGAGGAAALVLGLGRLARART